MTNKIDTLSCRRSNYDNADGNNINYNNYAISRSAIGLYALKAPETRRQYPRRLKVFLDYMKLEGPIEQQAVQFLTLIKQNSQWLQSSLIQFISFQKERASNHEISYSTIGNYYKATKLFIEINIDTPVINWKKISRGIPDRKKSC